MRWEYHVLLSISFQLACDSWLIVSERRHRTRVNLPTHNRGWLPHWVFRFNLPIVTSFSLALYRSCPLRVVTFRTLRATCHEILRLIWVSIAIQSITHLSLHLSFNWMLVMRVQNIHRLIVKLAYLPHEYLLQVILHHCLVSLVVVSYSLSLIKLISQAFNLFIILGTDLLEL